MILLRSTYTGTDEEVGALRPAHLAWLEGLVGDGVVIAAGRFEDGSGAGVLGAGTDGDALLAAFASDPYVAGGVATYAVVAAFPAAMGGDVIKQLDARERQDG